MSCIWTDEVSSLSPERRHRDAYVYCVTTIEQANLIAQHGFRNDDLLGRGVMVHLVPPVVRTEDAAIVVVLLDDLDLEAYIDGEHACIPACVLNAGYSELVN